MKKTRMILALVLVLAMALSLCACSKSGSSSYKDAVENYFLAMTGDADAMIKAMPEAVIEAGMEEEDMDRDEFEDEMKDLAEMLRESAEAEFGKNIKVKVDIEDKEKLDKDELEEIEDAMNEAYDAKMKVTDGYIVTGEATIKGKDDKDTDDFELTVVKIDGKWYVASMF